MATGQGGPLRRREVDCHGVRACLSYYAGGRQRPHRHDYAQISFLLAGAMRERLDGRDYALDYPAIGNKPPGAAHEDEWAGEGVLIFSLKIDGDRSADSPLGARRPSWARLRDAGTVGRLVRACLVARAGGSRREAAEDLLDMCGETEASIDLPSPPLWLRTARTALLEAPDEMDVNAAARAAGVDRSHFSRLFRRHYGLPPSLFRQRRLAGRAVEMIAQSDEAFNMIALDAGFCDQAHLTRSLRTQTGLPPGQLRRLLCDPGHIRSRRR